MIEAPNGDILVTEPRAGQVTILHVAADGSKAESHSVFAEGLSQPFGIEFYPNAENPEWVYVAETNRVVRYAYKPGDRKASGKPEIVVPSIPAGAGHFTRDIVFSPDGKKMYLSVGSGSNTAEEMDKKPLAEAQAWDKEKGATGATWGVEEGRADVLVYDVGSTAPGRIYATGLRNCVSLAIEPKTSDLWCAVNERDMLGDDLVPDYATRVKEGGYYGWPWYYFGSHEDPSLVGQRPDLKGKAIVPDVPFQAHSAALNLAFYTASSGKSAFPAEYVGDGFAVFHGSWNRGFRTGHKVVRIIMKDGVPTGEYQDFLTGFIVDDGNAWGRPVAVEELKDGSLRLSEDGNDTIYRISYSAQ
jgi:glucose/arabinose dehydrogenase